MGISASPPTESSLLLDPATLTFDPATLIFDPFSSPFDDYRPGTPPILVALYVVVAVWTLLFAYGMYYLHRCDEKRRRVRAHAQWRRAENLHERRSPKKAGGRFESRGMGCGEREMGVHLGRHGV
jgi:hypothetical protein